MLIPANTRPAMSFREIAELVDSRHEKVKQSIDRLVERGRIVQPPLADEPGFDSLGRPRITQVYRIGKRVIPASGTRPDMGTAIRADGNQRIFAPVNCQNGISSLSRIPVAKRSPFGAFHDCRLSSSSRTDTHPASEIDADHPSFNRNWTASFSKLIDATNGCPTRMSLATSDAIRRCFSLPRKRFIIRVKSSRDFSASSSRRRAASTSDGSPFSRWNSTIRSTSSTGRAYTRRCVSFGADVVGNAVSSPSDSSRSLSLSSIVHTRVSSALTRVLTLGNCTSNVT